MSVLVVGLSHHSAPIDLLEQVTLTQSRAGELADRLSAGEHVHEVLVLSTCNRLELVTDAATFHGALTEIGEALCEVSGLTREELTNHLYVHYDERAVAHLFGLACGLDSMAVGETQILGQLRDAVATAQQRAHLGPSLNPLLQHALRVGKRAHAETKIDGVSRSLMGLALDQARSALPDLAKARSVVIGAGSMSGLAVRTLVDAGVEDLTVVNRTPGRARRLAARHAGRLDVRAADWSELGTVVGSADLVVACTGSTGHVIDEPMLARARVDAGRSSSPQVVVDLALPRDVDPAVTRLAGVRLYGLAELQRWLDRGESRQEQVTDVIGAWPATDLWPTDDRPEDPDAGDDGDSSDATATDPVVAVRELVTGEVASFLAERQAARLGPTLAALRASAAQVVDAEMNRLDQRLPLLPDDERAEVRQTVQRVVDKLLHTPTVRVKQLQAAQDLGPEDYAHALRELFDLDPHQLAVVSTPPPELRTDPLTRPGGSSDAEGRQR